MQFWTPLVKHFLCITESIKQGETALFDRSFIMRHIKLNDFNVNMFDYNMTETSVIRLIIFMSTYLTQVTKFVRLEIFWVSAVVCLWSDFY